MPFLIIILALGAFAIGTDEYLVAGMLPTIATDMHVSEAIAGQLATIFALTYALGSPPLAILTARIERKRLLVGTILLFALANLAAVFVPSAQWLFVTRFIAALAAGFYFPMAMAVAAHLVERHQQGRAIAAIMGGTAGALVLGLPLGSWIGSTFGWRASFAIVALVGGIVMLLLAILLPRLEPTDKVVTLGERLALLSKKRVLLALVITFLALLGATTILTYIMPLLLRLTTFDARMLSIVLFASGLASMVGNVVGGFLADRWGTRRVLSGVFGFMMLNALSFSLLMLFQPSALMNAIVIVAFVVWGLVGWLGAPALNSYLVSLEPQAATIALSLNMTALYLGIASAGALGGIVLSVSGVAYLGIASGLVEALTLLLVLTGVRTAHKVRSSEPQPVASPAIQGSGEE